jgi:hypothetical protein
VDSTTVEVTRYRSAMVKDVEVEVLETAPAQIEPQEAETFDKAAESHLGLDKSTKGEDMLKLEPAEDLQKLAVERCYLKERVDGARERSDSIQTKSSADIKDTTYPQEWTRDSIFKPELEVNSGTAAYHLSKIEASKERALQLNEYTTRALADDQAQPQAQGPFPAEFKKPRPAFSGCADLNASRISHRLPSVASNIVNLLVYWWENLCLFILLAFMIQGHLDLDHQSWDIHGDYFWFFLAVLTPELGLFVQPWIQRNSLKPSYTNPPLQTILIGVHFDDGVNDSVSAEDLVSSF